MKRFAKEFLLALDYAHECHIIDTDITPQSIKVQIPNLLVIDDYLERASASLAAYDPASDPSTIASQPLKDFYVRKNADSMTLLEPHPTAVTPS